MERQLQRTAEFKHVLSDASSVIRSLIGWGEVTCELSILIKVVHGNTTEQDR